MMSFYLLYGGSCPVGWSQKSLDIGRFAYATNTSVDGTAGALSLSHSHATGTSGNHRNCGSSGEDNCSKDSTDSTAVNIYPAGIKYNLCTRPKFENFIPKNSIIISDTSSCPSGYTAYSGGYSKYVLFTSTDGDAGSDVSGDMGSHLHAQNGATIAQGFFAGGANPAVNTGSSNTITAYTGLYHHKLLLCKKD